MTSGPSVTAGWALWSKEPGTRSDYSVLSFSDGPLSKGEFAQLLAHFAPGSPSAEPDTAGSLPWVTLSRVGVGQELYVGVSVQTGTSDKDGAGRPISRTVYFCVPYAPLARAPVSYQDLYAAVTGPGLLASAGRNVIPLAVPPLDPAALARLVLGGFGNPEMVTRTAAMLLAGPVTVTGPQFPPLEDRLRFFDAVAALLPYGYRAYLTAASWSDSGAGERFRLVFANRAQDESSRVSWGNPPRPPTSGPAAEYLGYLDRALRGAGAERLESVIEYLSQASSPCKFDEPGRAVQRLTDFFRPAVVAEGLDYGGASLSDIRLLFDDGRIREMAASPRTQSLRQLIRNGDPQDMDRITRWYSEIADDPEALFTDVATACRISLWSYGSGGLARQYLGLMMRPGRTDDLLASLVPGPGADTDPMPGLDALGPLLAELAIAAPAGTDAFPHALAALERSPAAGAALLAYLASSREPGNPSLVRAAEWLERVMDEVVRPFVMLFGDTFGCTPDTVDTAAISRLDGHGELASIRYLLRAASYRKRLYLALPGFAGWLATGRGDAAGPDTRYWGDAVRELTPASTEEAAWLDLVLLVTGNEPRRLLSGRESQPQFSRQLAQAWQELAAAAGTQGAAADELAERALTAFLQRAPWRAERAQAAAVTELVQALTAQVARPGLLKVALDPLQTLRQMPPGASPGEIAEVCVRAHAEQIGIRQIVEALAQSSAVTSAQQAVILIDRVHTEMAMAGAWDESFDWPFTLATTLAQGGTGIGRVRLADFASRAAAHSSEEIFYRIRMLGTIAHSVSRDASSPIDGRLLEYLESCRQELDDLMREARKRQPRGGLTGKLLNRGGEGKPTGPPADAETATGPSGGRS